MDDNIMIMDDDNINFIENNFMNEIKGYKSQVDYNKLFNDLQDDVKNDLILEMKRYILIFTEFEKENDTYETINLSFYMDHLKNISDMNIDIEIYFTSYIYNDSKHVKLGFTVFLQNSRENILQYMSFYNYDLVTKNDLKNYIFNLLFYIHIFLRDFTFDSLFNHFYHTDDIIEMKNIRNRNLRLFGNITSECSVCLENCITKTYCNHILCFKCYSKLVKKICPECRAELEITTNEEEMYQNISFVIETE